MKKIFCHSDMDGFSSAHQIKILFPDSKIFPINYAQNPSFEKRIIKNDEVWIVDFSFTEKEMDELYSITENIIWIDHHISAFTKLKKYDHLAGIRSDDLCGAELTWIYLQYTKNENYKKIKNENLIRFWEKMPFHIKLVGDFDCWVFKFGEIARYLNEYFMTNHGSFGYNPSFWIDMQKPEKLKKFIEKGKKIREEKLENTKNLIEKHSFICDFEGYKTIVCKLEKFISVDVSDFFKFSNTDLALAISYRFSKKHNFYKYSIRSRDEKVNVRIIAEKYKNGGGHDYAVGWISENDIFEN